MFDHVDPFIGPVITTDTGGTGEAVGDTALVVPVDSPSSITAAPGLPITMPLPERTDVAERGRAHALQFDRRNVFHPLPARVDEAAASGAAESLAGPSRLALR